MKIQFWIGIVHVYALSLQYKRHRRLVENLKQLRDMSVDRFWGLRDLIKYHNKSTFYTHHITKIMFTTKNTRKFRDYTSQISGRYTYETEIVTVSLCLL